MIEEAIWLEKNLTNNEVEYEALIYRMELTLKLGVQHLKINVDSELVSGQLNGMFKAKDSRMKQYCDTPRIIMERFKSLKIQAIKRGLNARADALAKGVAHRYYNKKGNLGIEKDNSWKHVEGPIPKVNVINVSKEPIEDEC